MHQPSLARSDRRRGQKHALTSAIFLCPEPTGHSFVQNPFVRSPL